MKCNDLVIKFVVVLRKRKDNTIGVCMRAARNIVLECTLVDILQCTGDELICENLLVKLIIHQSGSIDKTSVMISENSHFPSFVLKRGRLYALAQMHRTHICFVQRHVDSTDIIN